MQVVQLEGRGLQLEELGFQLRTRVTVRPGQWALRVTGNSKLKLVLPTSNWPRTADDGWPRSFGLGLGGHSYWSNDAVRRAVRRAIVRRPAVLTSFLNRKDI